MTIKEPATNRERSFGLSVGAVCCAIAAVLAWRGRIGRAELLGAVGFVLVVTGLLKPALLRLPSLLWWKLAHTLGWINTRVLLGLAFALMLVPLSAVRRLLGKDPLMRRRERWRGWSPYPARYRDRHHYVRMY